VDSVRTAKRLGADEATIVYRRGMAELPARAEEVHHAEQEGIRFELLVAPLEVLGDENRWSPGSGASAWSWANRTPPAGADPPRSRAPSS